MNEVMNVCGTDVEIKEYSDQRVVTFADIDRVHHRPEGTAKRNFSKNNKHFIKNVDYYIVGSNEIRTTHIFSISDNDFRDKTLITETGYFMLTKSFRDDLAWEVQRMLVSTYFKVREEKRTLSVEDAFKMVKLINKTPDNRLSLVKAVLVNAGIDIPLEEKDEVQQFHTTPRGRLEYTKKYADMNGVGDFLKTVDSVINEPTALVYVKYKAWCEVEERKPTTHIMFSKIVNQYLGTKICIMNIKGHTKRIFVEEG